MKNAILSLLALMCIASPAMAELPCTSINGFIQCPPKPFNPNFGQWWEPAAGGTSFTLQLLPNATTIFITVLGYSDTGSGAPDWYLASVDRVDDSANMNVYMGSNIIQCSGGQGLTSPAPQAPNCVFVPKPIVLTMNSVTSATLTVGARTSNIVPYSFQ